MHHDFELEPEVGLPGQPPPPPSKGPRKKLDVFGQRWPLGFQPLDVFDLWQVRLGLGLGLGLGVGLGVRVRVRVRATYPYPYP